MGLTTVHRYCATALPVISVINEVIFVKFGTMIDIGHAKVIVAKYPTFGKIQDDGGRHLEFSIFGHISVVNEDNFVKFGTLIDISHTRVTVANIRFLRKFNMAAVAILNVRFLAISQS